MTWEAFIRDCANNWDCDTGAGGAHSPHCRACNARALLEAAEKVLFEAEREAAEEEHLRKLP